MKTLKIKFDPFLFLLSICGFVICITNSMHRNTGIRSEFRHVFWLYLAFSSLFLLASISDNKGRILSAGDSRLLKLLRFEIYTWLAIIGISIIAFYLNLPVLGLGRSYTNLAYVFPLLPLGSIGVFAYHLTSKARKENKDHPDSWKESD